MEYFMVRNWEKFQHYKYRNPPWVRLYQDTLASESWVMGTDADRVLMVTCILLASRTQNKIPANNEYIKRVACLQYEPDFQHLIDTDFLVLVDNAGNALAPRAQSAVPEKSRVEKRREEKKRSASPPLFDSFWNAYPKKIGKGAAKKAWGKIKPGQRLAETIVGAIESQKKSPQWTADGGKFIPHPATWLNQERWEDSTEVDKPEPTGPKINPRNQWRDPDTGRIWTRIDLEDLAASGKLPKDVHDRAANDLAPWGWML